MEIIILIVFIILLLAFDLRIKKVNICLASPKIVEEIRFLVIADFHGNKAQSILKKITVEHIDAVLILGDFFDDNMKNDEPIKLVSELNKIAPVFYISGNHEYKNKKLTYPEIDELLRKNNVKVLNDEIITFKNLNLIGIQDCRSFKNGHDYTSEKVKIQRLLKNIDNNTYNIVMIHRPDHYKQFDRFLIDCMLSGHAHGGQWRIPYLINGFFAPGQGLFPKRAGGIYDLKHGKHIVSRGLCIFPHFYRLFNRPELIFLTIKKDNS